jgi:transcriptional regulator with XRE-family HTH domain
MLDLQVTHRGYTPPMSKRHVSKEAHEPMWRTRIAAAVAPHGRLTAIATAAGMKSPQLQKIANGTTKDPGIATLDRIASAMGSSLDALLTEPRSARGGNAEREAAIEDRLAELIAYIKTLKGNERSRFIRAAVALLTALEHTGPAAATGTAPDDAR